MKIICESQEEYDSLMATSRYLHDYLVCVKKATNRTRIEERDANGDMVRLNRVPGSMHVYAGLDNDFEKVSFLQHLYLDGKDWPNKKDYVWIEDATDER